MLLSSFLSQAFTLMGFIHCIVLNMLHSCLKKQRDFHCNLVLFNDIFIWNSRSLIRSHIATVISTTSKRLRQRHISLSRGFKLNTSMTNPRHICHCCRKLILRMRTSEAKVKEFLLFTGNRMSFIFVVIHPAVCVSHVTSTDGEKVFF